MFELMLFYSRHCGQHDSVQRQVHDSAQDGASQPAQREGVSVHRAELRPILHSIPRVEAGPLPDEYGLTGLT